MKAIKISYLATLIALMSATNLTAETNLQAVRADKPPVLDGNDKEALWQKGIELQLLAKVPSGTHEGEKTSVFLKAAYDDDHLYFLVRWQDATKDDTHKSYVWNESKSSYEVGPDREDVVAFSFPIRGEFTADMLSGKDELWDVWHWKAARTAPASHAMDKTHAYSTSMPSGKANKFEAKDGSVVWISRPEDAGGSATASHPAPKSKQAATPVHYEAVMPSGSAADVRAGQSHRGGWWTVEFARKLNTGHSDDAQFSVPGSYQMGVAVFDHSEDEDHYTTEPIVLRLGDEHRATGKP